MGEYSENPDPKYEKYERFQAEKMVSQGILGKNYSGAKENNSELAKRKIQGIREMLEKK